ncbi:tyrosine aminotransferase [Fonticula alba]|uniref:Tyrosine aminotransferase n=1 Tax=Fonticula alba TaxID=691883 RepID=A0A058Z8H0_FONAL|nr:tyrosine aminotransferase [Fonticula alba]KCV70535.1 tyrosine aminotransferase [Fonticula alba]|eukprot:XP_009495051.1 tyrosine aminotransferase [Fonticula alba]
MTMSDFPVLKASASSLRTTNPIRQIVDGMKTVPNPDLADIRLSIGDPTIFGNFSVPDSVNAALVEAINSKKFNGYPPSTGYESARAAIAKAYGSDPRAPLTPADVIIASGCSGAIELAISAMADEGQNILLPRPGFSLYQTIAEARGVEVRHYDLVAEKNWEASIESIEALIDAKTAFILITNPSNPCGSNYSEAHLLELLAVAQKHRLPIFADEIYADMVFSGQTFTHIARLSTDVPVISAGGLAKRFMVPGWRLGWLTIHDRHGQLAQIRDGLNRLSQLVLGANSLLQGVLPTILLETEQSYFDNNNRMLEELANTTVEAIRKIPGLQPIAPQGAMYVMVKIDPVALPEFAGNDSRFCERLIAEQSVHCLPGACFGVPGYFRIVFTSPKEKLAEAFARMADFCRKYHVSQE